MDKTKENGRACGHFLLVVNTGKDRGLKYVSQLKALIEKMECSARIILGDDSGKLTHIPREILEGVDCVIVLGGDGTLLRVSHAIEGTNLPVIGVNLGTVGFLTEIVTSGMEEMVRRLISGDYVIEDRMMLAGRIRRKDGTEDPQEYRALNDVVLARETALRLIALKIYVNGRLFDTCEADGIIVSTPTGSTGYNLSAGGPIVNSDARLLVMTPIAPYSLSRRSVVFGADDEIVLELVEKHRSADNTGIVSFDGYNNHILSVGDRVTVYTSGEKLRLIRMDNASLYEVLRKKLGG